MPLTVKVTWGARPSPGSTIAWAVTAGGGTATALTGTSDARGVASVGWTLGAVAGAAQTLTATAAGFAGPPITFTASAAPGAPVRLAFRSQPTDTMSGTAIAPPVRVALEDRLGNVAADATVVVTVELGVNPGAGSLAGTRQAITAGGVATLGDLSIDRMGAGYRLAASAPGLPLALSESFAVTVNLAFVDQPTEAFAGALISPAVKLRATEAGVPIAGVSVSLDLEGSGAGVLIGGAQASTGAGRDRAVRGAEGERPREGYRLVATGCAGRGARRHRALGGVRLLETDQEQPVVDQTSGSLVVGERLRSKSRAGGHHGGGRRPWWESGVPVQCSRGTLEVSIQSVTGLEPNDVTPRLPIIRRSRSAAPPTRPSAIIRCSGWRRPPLRGRTGLRSCSSVGRLRGSGRDPTGDSYPEETPTTARSRTPRRLGPLDRPGLDLPFQTIMR